VPLGALDPDVASTLHNNGAPPELFYNISPHSSFVFLLQLDIYSYMLRTLARMAPKTWTKESFTVRTVIQDCGNTRDPGNGFVVEAPPARLVKSIFGFTSIHLKHT
jgi:hypothetical protein